MIRRPYTEQDGVTRKEGEFKFYAILNEKPVQSSDRSRDPLPDRECRTFKILSGPRKNCTLTAVCRRLRRQILTAVQFPSKTDTTSVYDPSIVVLRVMTINSCKLYDQLPAFDSARGSDNQEFRVYSTKHGTSSFKWHNSNILTMCQRPFVSLFLFLCDQESQFAIWWWRTNGDDHFDGSIGGGSKTIRRRWTQWKRNFAASPKISFVASCIHLTVHARYHPP